MRRPRGMGRLLRLRTLSACAVVPSTRWSSASLSLCRTRAGLSSSRFSRHSAPPGLSLNESRHILPSTGILVIGIGCWMLRTQMRLLPVLVEDQAHAHSHGQGPHYHSHGWGVTHSHDIDAISQVRPKLAILLALGIAGGLLPDPGALAILLAAIAGGKLVLGLLTVLVFSLGFASVLVVVGVVAARVGQLILAWLSSRWVGWVQIGAALLIVVVGLILTANA